MTLLMWTEDGAPRLRVLCTSPPSHTAQKIISQISLTFGLHKCLMKLPSDKRASFNWGRDSGGNLKWDHAECVMNEGRGGAQGQSWARKHWLTAVSDRQSDVSLVQKHLSDNIKMHKFMKEPVWCPPDEDKRCNMQLKHQLNVKKMAILMLLLGLSGD